MQIPLGSPAGDLTGGTGFDGGQVGRFEGVEAIDYDDLVDRNEQLVLLSAVHRLTAYANSTETADGNVRAAVEVSSSPSRDVADSLVGPDDVADSSTGNVEVFDFSLSDSIDLLGRPLLAVGHAPFSDGASGVGGGGSVGTDEVKLSGLPPSLGRFHPRDELFVNGTFEVWNIDDAGIHFEVTLQHVYGVETQ